MPETPITPTTDNSTGQVSYSEFAAKIRAKYPKSQLYKSKPDKELVEAWIQAKPERAVYVKKIKGYDPLGEKPGSVPSSIPAFVPKGIGSKGVGIALEDKRKYSTLDATKDQFGAALPSAGGMIGGILGKTPGATLGGGAGELIKQMITRPSFLEPDPTIKGSALKIVIEAAKQGLEEKGSQYIGKGFFYLLGKIPHAAIQQGVKFLPHELPGNKNSVVSKYIADLLTNLVPSAKTMSEDAAVRNARVIGAAEKLAKGFGRTQGTSEEIGLMVKEALEQERQELLKQGASATGGPSSVQKAFGMTAIQKEYDDIFKNALAEHIANEGKPEAIIGYIRGTAGLEDTRTILGFLKEKEKSKIVNAVKSRLMSDIIQETLTGTKDPILKELQKQDTRFIGSEFKNVLDKVGEEKLKVIYGPESYENIIEFSKLVKNLGQPAGGFGRWMNAILLLGPVRSGFTLVAGKRIAQEGFVFNRLAKYITSTEGIRITENYTRAISIGAKVPNAVYDQMKAFNERQDREYIEDQKTIEDQYYKDHPDEVKYRNINKPQEPK